MQPFTKGGITGLIYSDFDKRQKSGDWSIDDHLSNVNYIRDGEIPNNYLMVGCYDEKKLIIYSIFNFINIVTNVFNINGIITSIDYNSVKNLVVFSITKPPYIKIFSTIDFSEKVLKKTLKQPSICAKFSTSGDFLFISSVRTNTDNFISVFETTNYTEIVNSLGIKLNELVTCIETSIDDKYICFGHYDNLVSTYGNIKLYKKQAQNNYININEFNLDSLDLGTVTDLCFLDNYKLLFISSYKNPYLHIYNYERQEVVSNYNNTVNALVDNKINCLTKTSDSSKILMGLDKEPYLVQLDILKNSISAVGIKYFEESITSLSFSVNDKYLCVTQRGNPSVQIFEYLQDGGITPISLNVLPNTVPLCSQFILGPVTSFIEIEKPKYSLSSDDNCVVAINEDKNLVFSGIVYDDNVPDINPDLSAHKNIFQTQVYKSLDYNTTYITSIKIDGSLVSNDQQITSKNFNNIIQISSYLSRIALLDSFNSIHLLDFNNFSYEEIININQNFNKNIKQISVGYQTLLALTIDGKVKSSSLEFFDPYDYVLPQIQQVSSGWDHIALLTMSNTVLCYGDNTYNQCETSSWTDIRKVSTGNYFTLGLTLNNQVLVASNFISQVDKDMIEAEENVVDIFNGYNKIYLIKSDGSVSGYSEPPDVSLFENIGATV